MVRTTEYAVLEDTLARRTFDESGDYVLQNPDFDVREHLVSGNNRGIFSASDNGLATTKLAIGVSPFKAYVNGYESERLGTTFVDVDKARDFDTANNNKTRFTLDNYFNVKMFMVHQILDLFLVMLRHLKQLIYMIQKQVRKRNRTKYSRC